MKVKVLATGEIVEVVDYNDSKVTVYRDDETEFLAQNEYSCDEVEFLPDTEEVTFALNEYSRNEVEFLPDTEEVTIEGYVARDKCGNIYLYPTEPFRGVEEWHEKDEMHFYIPKEFFPEVTWDSEPKRVKITITPME